jgi:hypothetical protein
VVQEWFTVEPAVGSLAQRQRQGLTGTYSLPGLRKGVTQMGFGTFFGRVLKEAPTVISLSF